MSVNREILADALVKHLERDGATVTNRGEILDATTHEPYATVFVLNCPLGSFHFEIRETR